MVLAELFCGLSVFAGGVYCALDKENDTIPRIGYALASLCGLGFAILAF